MSRRSLGVEARELTAQRRVHHGAPSGRWAASGVQAQPSQCRRPSPAAEPHDDGGPPAAGHLGQGSGVEQGQVELVQPSGRGRGTTYKPSGPPDQRNGFPADNRGTRVPSASVSTRTVSPVARRYRSTARTGPRPAVDAPGTGSGVAGPAGVADPEGAADTASEMPSADMPRTFQKRGTRSPIQGA